MKITLQLVVDGVVRSTYMCEDTEGDPQVDNEKEVEFWEDKIDDLLNSL